MTQPFDPVRPEPSRRANVARDTLRAGIEGGVQAGLENALGEEPADSHSVSTNQTPPAAGLEGTLEELIREEIDKEAEKLPALKAIAGRITADDIVRLAKQGGLNASQAAGLIPDVKMKQKDRDIAQAIVRAVSNGRQRYNQQQVAAEKAQVRLEREKDAAKLGDEINPQSSHFKFSIWYQQVFISEYSDLHGQVSAGGVRGRDLLDFIERVIKPVAPDFRLSMPVEADVPLTDMSLVQDLFDDFTEQITILRRQLVPFVRGHENGPHLLAPLIPFPGKPTPAGRQVPTYRVQVSPSVTRHATSDAGYVVIFSSEEERFEREIYPLSRRMWREYPENRLPPQPDLDQEMEFLMFMQRVCAGHAYGRYPLSEALERYREYLLTEERAHSDFFDFADRHLGRPLRRERRPADAVEVTRLILREGGELRRNLEALNPESLERQANEAATIWEVDAWLASLRDMPDPAARFFMILSHQAGLNPAHTRALQLTRGMIRRALFPEAANDRDWRGRVVTAIADYKTFNQTLRDMARSILEREFIPLEERERISPAIQRNPAAGLEGTLEDLIRQEFQLDQSLQGLVSQMQPEDWTYLATQRGLNVSALRGLAGRLGVDKKDRRVVAEVVLSVVQRAREQFISRESFDIEDWSLRTFLPSLNELVQRAQGIGQEISGRELEAWIDRVIRPVHQHFQLAFPPESEAQVTMQQLNDLYQDVVSQVLVLHRFLVFKSVTPGIGTVTARLVPLPNRQTPAGRRVPCYLVKMQLGIKEKAGGTGSARWVWFYSPTDDEFIQQIYPQAERSWRNHVAVQQRIRMPDVDNPSAVQGFLSWWITMMAFGRHPLEEARWRYREFILTEEDGHSDTDAFAEAWLGHPLRDTTHPQDTIETVSRILTTQGELRKWFNSQPGEEQLLAARMIKEIEAWLISLRDSPEPPARFLSILGDSFLPGSEHAGAQERLIPVLKRELFPGVGDEMDWRKRLVEVALDYTAFSQRLRDVARAILAREFVLLDQRKAPRAWRPAAGLEGGAAGTVALQRMSMEQAEQIIETLVSKWGLTKFERPYLAAVTPQAATTPEMKRLVGKMMVVGNLNAKILILPEEKEKIADLIATQLLAQRESIAVIQGFGPEDDAVLDVFETMASTPVAGFAVLQRILPENPTFRNLLREIISHFPKAKPVFIEEDDLVAFERALAALA